MSRYQPSAHHTRERHVADAAARGWERWSGVSTPASLREATPVGTVDLVTDLPPPTLTSRLVVGALAAVALLTGAFVLSLAAFFALYAGVPVWVVAVAVAAVPIGLAAAFQRVRRTAARQ
jgi:hypothetical protein